MTERRIDVPGLSLAAKEWGASSSRKVLALHGWLDNAASFDGLAPVLPDAHIVAIDLPGHGRSEHRSANDTYHFIDWIPEVAAAADALGWSRFSLMGHSMGAAIAAIAAGTMPERVESVVLLDGIAPFTTPAEDAPETLAKFIRQRTRLLDKKRPVYASRDEAIGRLLQVTTLTPAAAATLADRNIRACVGGVEWTYDPRLRYISPMRFTEEHNRAFLSRIAAPVLLVRPSAGIPIDASVLAGWTSAVSDLQMVAPEGGHHVHLEYPERIAADVAAFLNRACLPSR